MIEFLDVFHLFHRYMPYDIIDNVEDSLITWLLVTICSSNMIKNPYLVAKLVEVVFVIIPGIQPRSEMLYSRLMNHPITETILPSALMKFYTDVETTGSSSEFYDKFSIRYHISLIIKGSIYCFFSINVFNVIFFVNRNVEFADTPASVDRRVENRQSVR